MPDDAAQTGDREKAAARDAAEQDSLFAHAPVEPDATAAYGDDPDQVIDFYAPRRRPAGNGPAPLVVVLHGGAWRATNDRRHISPFARLLTERGFAVANVEYRRGGGVPASPDPSAPSPGGRWPDTLDDVAAACDALPALVPPALPMADLRRTVLTGHSAGGHLALWVAARHLLPADAPWRTERSAPLRGVVGIAPIADFTVAAKLGVCAGAAEDLLGGPEHDAARRPYADPALLLPTGIATALVQGREDIVVPEAVTASYARAAADAGEVVGVTLLAEAGHYAPIDPAAAACAVVAEEIAQLAW